MKAKMFILVVLLTSTFILSACADNDPKVPFSQLSFETEDNPSYIGSYFITRTNELNAKWDEWGEWTPLDFSSREVCFGMFQSDNFGVFRARSDYHWVEEGGCLKLQKRQ